MGQNDPNKRLRTKVTFRQNVRGKFATQTTYIYYGREKERQVRHKTTWSASNRKGRKLGFANQVLLENELMVSKKKKKENELISLEIIIFMVMVMVMDDGWTCPNRHYLFFLSQQFPSKQTISRHRHKFFIYYQNRLLFGPILTFLSFNHSLFVKLIGKLMLVSCNLRLYFLLLIIFLMLR